MINVTWICLSCKTDNGYYPSKLDSLAIHCRKCGREFYTYEVQLLDHDVKQESVMLKLSRKESARKSMLRAKDNIMKRGRDERSQ